MQRIVKYLVLAASTKNKNGNSKTSTSYNLPHIQTIILRLLVAILLGECVLYNKSDDSGRDAFTVVDVINQMNGLAAYFLKFDEMHKSVPFLSAKASQHRKPLARSSTPSMSEIEDFEENNDSSSKHDEDPVLMSVSDTLFVNFVKKLESEIRERINDAFSHPKSKVAVVPAEMEQKNGESNEDYIKRLKSFIETQCKEIQDLLGRNATLAEDMARTGGASVSWSDQANGGMERIQVETLRRDL